jgi:NAD(P)-dependent dehydrogenase (short-subunit alcohol dehydrogenase family)
VLQADIRREAGCRTIAQTCIERYGRIDILHNNVGSSTGDRKTACPPHAPLTTSKPCCLGISI